jgi:hypothetical protein
MQKVGRPLGSKNTPKRTLDLRDYIPPKPPKPAKFKITSSQRKLLKSYNPDGLPDFRTKEFKRLSFDEKEDYILNELAIAKENRKEEQINENLDYTKIDVSTFRKLADQEIEFTAENFLNLMYNIANNNQNNNENNNKEYNLLLPIFYKIYKKYIGNNVYK